MKKETVLLVVAGALAAGGGRAAQAATCTQVGATALDIELDVDEDITIKREAGFLKLGGRICASAAVNWDIDVVGNTGNESVTFNELTGSLNSYDWVVSLGDGRDGVVFVGSGARNRYAIGTRAGNYVFQFLNTSTRIAMIIQFDVEEFTMRGGAGADTLRGRAVTSAGTFLFDQRLNLFGQAGTDVLEGGIGNDVLDGGDSNDSLQGAAGSDVLRGGGGIDVLNGGDDADKLIGGAGNDTENGGGGNDVFSMGPASDGNDILNGGDGIDTVSYSARSVDLTINLGGTAGQAGEVDTVGTIENANGGSGNDVLVGDAGRNRLEGNAGDDHLDGDLGGDTLDCGDGNDTWTDPDGLPNVNCETEVL